MSGVPGRKRAGVGLRRKGQILYKESVYGINVIVFTYGKTGKTGEASVASGREYTLNVVTIPLEVAQNAKTPDDIKDFYKLGMLVRRDGKEIDEEEERTRIAALESLEKKEKEEEKLKAAIVWRERRTEQWPKVSSNNELERLRLFAEYVGKDRELRQKKDEVSLRVEAEKLLKELSPKTREELLRTLGILPS